MTFQEANKNSRELFSRINLTYEETVRRLSKYFSDEEVEEILKSAQLGKSWTDGNIVVICDRYDGKYIIVASGIYMELIQP